VPPGERPPGATLPQRAPMPAGATPPRLPRVAGDAGGVLGRALAAHKPALIPATPGVWRASVALVLRWTQPAPPSPSAPLRTFLRAHAGALELLLIQRALRPLDPWSGHIGFPGGRREEADDGDLGAALRETREELGIDLCDDVAYRLLGQLDDEAIPASRAGRKGGVLSSFVFLQRPPVADGHDTLGEGATAPPMVLDAAEVAACLWVPVESLLRGSRARAAHVFPIRSNRLGVVGRLTPAPLLRLLGMHRVVYTAVDVFGACTEIVYADGEDSGADGKAPDVEAAPLLWGMSFRAASDLIRICGGKSHVANRPAFVFDNRLLALLHRGVHRAVCLVARRLAFLGRLGRRRRQRRLGAHG
jgi:8-oxo-dGTP pyrophosphatase MutT (NUDIX family)